MSAAAQTARMVLRAPVAKAALPIRLPAAATRAAQAAAAVPVSRASDPAEREAERVARRIIAMPAPALTPQARRFAGALPSSTQIPTALGVSTSIGQPLPRRLRRDMEPRFQADFSNVRVHTGDAAARASRRLNAAAFTSGRDVFFGRDRFQPDARAGRELIAHELTHTIQQGAASQTIHRSVDGLSSPVLERAAPQTVHRLGVQDALDFFADKAAWIPGFSLLALLLGFNPVSLRAVPRTAANLLRAMIQLIPGGPLITQALDNHGIVDKVAGWAEGQLSALGDIGSAIRQSIDDFLDGLSWTDIFDLDGVWTRAKRIVTEPVDRIIAFGAGLVGGIIGFIKDAILQPIAALIEPTRGYPLLKAILGFDPVTGAAVPRTPASLLGGFMTLIGQEEIWQNIQRGNAVAQAYAWFLGALAGLMGLVSAIPARFLAAFQSLQLVDIILVPRAFARIIGVFGSIAGAFLSWGLGTVIKLLEIIFSVVAPGAMGYLRRAGGAIQGIFRNPIGFVSNLVGAAKAGFQRFGRNILRHLQTGIISWLTGSLPGIYIPQGLSLPEILKFVLSVLGLSWANIRQKLVTAVGEVAVRAMELGFDLVLTLVRDGPAAAWAQMQQELANLRQMAIDGLIDMVVDLVLGRAVPRLVAMFIPGAGFIGAIMSIYGTVTTFIAQLGRIAQVITSFLDSMMAIAAGNIAAAATRVETTLAGLLTLAINFLAGFAGLGRVADQVRGVIQRIRAPIDRALDRVVTWIVTMARRLGRFVAQAGLPTDPQARLRLAASAGAAIVNRFAGRPVAAALLNPLLAVVRARYGLTSIMVLAQGRRWAVQASINPSTIHATEAFTELVAATEQRNIAGPLPLGQMEQLLTQPPFNYRPQSPAGRRAIDRILASVQASGDVGFRMINLLVSGRLTGAQGLDALVSQIQTHQILTTYPVVLEALRMIDSLGKPATLLRFEDREASGAYDVDVGVLNPRGGYAFVNQVKRTSADGIVRNVNLAIGQLRGIRASRKSVVIYASGISAANLLSTLNSPLAAIASGTAIGIDIVLVDDRGVRIRYP
jgi:hypothetical protein